MNLEERKQFFARKEKEPFVARVGGKFSFSKIPNQIQEVIKKRLAEKDEVMSKGLKGEIPGLKIDGKQVTRDNIHEFELKPKGTIKVEKKVEETNQKSVPTITKVKELYTKSDLENMSFSKLKKIAKTFGETGRSKKGIIKDILKHL